MVHDRRTGASTRKPTHLYPQYPGGGYSPSPGVIVRRPETRPGWVGEGREETVPYSAPRHPHAIPNTRRRLRGQLA